MAPHPCDSRDALRRPRRISNDRHRTRNRTRRPRRPPMTDVMDRAKVTTHQQFIGGTWVDSASGKTLDVVNPANGKVIAKVPDSSPEDVDRAARAAAAAFPAWMKTTPAERMGMLLKLADAV